MKRKKTSTAYIFLILLGLVGGHKFYLKQYEKGFLYIFTFGLFGLGLLFDLFALHFQIKNFNILIDFLNNESRFSKYKYRIFKAMNSVLLFICQNGFLALKRGFCQDIEVIHIAELEGFSGSVLSEHTVGSGMGKTIRVLSPRANSVRSRANRAINRAASQKAKRGLLTLQFNDFDNPLFTLKFQSVPEAKEILQILKTLKKTFKSPIDVDTLIEEDIDVNQLVDEIEDDFLIN